jgi:hypothetical protein
VNLSELPQKPTRKNEESFPEKLEIQDGFRLFPGVSSQENEHSNCNKDVL